jgi:hypothetical protein
MKLPGKVHVRGMYGVEPIEADPKFKKYVLISPRSQ